MKLEESSIKLSDKGHVVYDKIQSNYKDIEEIFFNVMKGESFI